MTVYVVAISRKEAERKVKAGMVHKSERSARIELRNLQSFGLTPKWRKPTVWPVQVVD